MAVVVVVGAGLGGLAAAVRLAKLGHEVTVCERADRIGGAIGTLEADGFRWDTGPAWTTLPAALRDLFRKSGRPLEQVAELVTVQSPRRHVFADGTRIDLPVLDRAGQSRAWSELAGDAVARQWTELVDWYGEVWEVVRTTALEQAPPDKLPKPARKLLHRRTSLETFARKRLGDPRACAALTYHATQTGSEASRTPAYLGVTAYVERTFGYWTFEGGFAVLLDAFDKRLAERRVEVRLGTEVTAIETGHGSVRGVRLADGRLLPADIVVGDVDPRILYADLLDDPAAKPIRRNLAKTHDAQSTYVLHLGLGDTAPELPFETVLHGDPPVTIRAQGRAWTVLVHGYPPQDAVDLLVARGLDVRDRIVSRHVSASRYGGVAWEGHRTARLRAANVSPVRGLFCVGAGAHPGAGVPATTLGAAIVASAVGKA